MAGHVVRARRQDEAAWVFQNAKKAALVYDKAARAEYGTNAKVNFDKEGRPTDLVTFAYGGLHGEHQTVEVQPNTKWPRVGDAYQVDLAKALPKVAATAESKPTSSWHEHRLQNPDDDDNAGYVDTHYGSLHPSPLQHDADTNISKLWTPVEKAAFERAIFEVDKDFHLISKYVGTKCYRSCVEYYYCVWKLMRGCQKWKKSRDDVIVKFQQDEQKRISDLNRTTTPGRTANGNKMNGVAEEYQQRLMAANSGKGNGDNGKKSSHSKKNKNLVEAAEDPEKYCLCRGPGVGMMVACEVCEGWFHGACVGLGIAEDSLKEGDEFICGECTENGFPKLSTESSNGGKRIVKSLADAITVIWDSVGNKLLPKEECPKVRHLVRFLQSNPDYRPYYGESDDEDSADQDANMANLKVATDIGERLQVEVFKKLLRCPPYEPKEPLGIKKERARSKILNYCNRLDPWIEFNSSSEESESSEEESSEESSDEESSEEESSVEDDEEFVRQNTYLANLNEQELGYDLLPLSIDPQNKSIQALQAASLGQTFLDSHAAGAKTTREAIENYDIGARIGITNGSSAFSDRFLVSRQQSLMGLQRQENDSKRGKKRQRETPIVNSDMLPQGREPWHRLAPWNGGRVTDASSVERRETISRVKTLVERIQAHRIAIAAGSDTLRVQRRRMERLHGRPRVKRIKTSSDDSRTFTPKQFQTLMWQLWVTNNFIKKNQVPPAYAMHEAGGSGRQYRWSGLRCRSIGLIDGAIVASSPRNFGMYKSQIIDLPLNAFNMPPADVNTLTQT